MPTTRVETPPIVSATGSSGWVKYCGHHIVVVDCVPQDGLCLFMRDDGAAEECTQSPCIEHETQALSQWCVEKALEIGATPTRWLSRAGAGP